MISLGNNVWMAGPIGPGIRENPEYHKVSTRREGLFGRRETWVHIRDDELLGVAEISYGLLGTFIKFSNSWCCQLKWVFVPASTLLSLLSHRSAQRFWRAKSRRLLCVSSPNFSLPLLTEGRRKIEVSCNCEGRG